MAIRTTKKAEPKTTTAKTAIEKEAPAKTAAETALQDFTAAVDVVQMPIISVVLLTAHMRSAARCRKRGSNVPS